MAIERTVETNVYCDICGESEEDSAPCGMSVTEYTSGLEKGKLTELRKYEGILGQIQAIEDALTRVQARQQKAIEMLQDLHRTLQRWTKKPRKQKKRFRLLHRK